MSYCGPRNFFYVSEKNLLIRPIGNHTGPYKMGLDMFQEEFFERFFRKQQTFQKAKVTLNTAEDFFMDFMLELKERFLQPVQVSGRGVIKHCHKEYNKYRYSVTHCNKLYGGRPDQSVPLLVLEEPKFKKAVHPCPDCALKLEEG